jgi:hypothetical protein
VRHQLISTVSEQKNNLKAKVTPKHRHGSRGLQGISLQKTANFTYLGARNSITFP